MKIDKRRMKLVTLIAGFILAGAFAFFIAQANESDISVFQNQTTEVAELSKGTAPSTASYTNVAKCDDGSKCGEGKCGDGDGDKKDAKEGKTEKEKCGEGKCGDGDSKKKEKADKEKCGEGKCGEGKCGE